MKHFAVDLRAEALLLAVQETAGGDLRAAFAILCSRVAISDVNGETFEEALGRAVATLFAPLGAAGVIAPPAPSSPPAPESE